MVGLMVRDGKHYRALVRMGTETGLPPIGDREQILLGIGRGESLSAIARSLRRAPSTITREVSGQWRPPALLGLARPPAGP